MATSPRKPTTVVFACARADRAALAAELCNELIDAHDARAFAQAPPERTPVDLLVVLATWDRAADRACGARELWPLLDPRHTEDLPLAAVRERLRHHLLDMLERKGWTRAR